MEAVSLYAHAKVGNYNSALMIVNDMMKNAHIRGGPFPISLSTSIFIYVKLKTIGDGLLLLLEHFGNSQTNDAEFGRWSSIGTLTGRGNDTVGLLLQKVITHLNAVPRCAIMLRCLKSYLAGRALLAGLDMQPRVYESSDVKENPQARQPPPAPTMAFLDTRRNELRHKGVEVLMKGVENIRKFTTMPACVLENEMVDAIRSHMDIVGESLSSF